MLVGLGVFLMAIFAMPAGDSFKGCSKASSRGEVFATFEGTTIRRGDLDEMGARVRRVHAQLNQPLSDGLLAMRLAQLREAEQAGIRVSDEEVLDALRNEIFPRRLKVEHVIASNGAFGRDTSVSEEEIQQAYQQGKEKRFRQADGTPRPLAAVRDEIVAELRSKKGSELAKVAVADIKKRVDAMTGAAVGPAFRHLANENDLQFGETEVFTARTAPRDLRAIGEAPGIADRVFAEPIGRVSEPLPVAGGWCIFRVVLRTRGFGPDGKYHPEEERWAEAGYYLESKPYAEVLRERGASQDEIEETLREDRTIGLLPRLILGSVREVPRTTLHAFARRNNTRAVAAYFAPRPADFVQNISCTEQELRDFYDRHKGIPRAGTRIGYLEPERVRIEYVLARTEDLAKTLGEAEVRAYYDKNAADFKGSFAESREEVGKRLAEEILREEMKKIATRAADEATDGTSPSLAPLAREAAERTHGAIVVRQTPPFAASEIETVVPEISDVDLAKELFGERGKQFAVAGVKAQERQRVISEDFTCKAGQFFFRVLSHAASEAALYEQFVADPRKKQELTDDLRNDKAFTKAQEKARALRAKIYEAAFERFAARLGTKPLTTDLLKPDTPIPAVGKTVPAIYSQLLAGQVGDISDIVQVGDRLVCARLAAREKEGLRLQAFTFSPEGLKPAYEPSTYELRVAYDDDPYAYQDPPAPVPFGDVKGEIQKLLVSRQAQKLATERIEKALAELAGAPKPDLAAVAPKHNLDVQPNVSVKLDNPEATPRIGRAAGFRDAVTALKAGELSRIVASAEGKFLFVVKTRDDQAKAATLGVAAALYERARAEAKIDDKAVRQYYDEHRDTAYATGDEIQEPPGWDRASKSAQERVRKRLHGEWAAKPLMDQLSQLRDSLVLDAFRSVPPTMPLAITRNLALNAKTLGPFPLSKPEGELEGEKEAIEAIRSLKQGEVSKPLPTREGALLALLAERKPGGQARARIAAFRAADFLKAVAEPVADAILRYYDANKEAFRIPEQVTLEFAFADTEARQTEIEPKLTDAECRRYFEERRQHEYQDQDYENARPRVRGDLAKDRAEQEARSAATAAADALRKNEKADLAALAKTSGVFSSEKRLPMSYGTTEPFALTELIYVSRLGRIGAIPQSLRTAKPGAALPLIETSRGFAACRVATRTPSHIPSLEEARKDVAEAVKFEAARAAAAKAAEAFRAKAASSSFDKAAEDAKASKIVQTELLEAHRFIVPGIGAMPPLADAIFTLEKPGLTPVVTEVGAARSSVALVTELQREEMATLDVAYLDHWRLSVPAEGIPEEDLRKHYDAHKETFRVADQVQVEYLAVPYADLAKTQKATEEELRKEYERSIKEGETFYQDLSVAPRVAFLPFERAREMVERRVLHLKAQAEADKLLAEAAKALRADKTGDFKAYATRRPPLRAGKSDFLDRERKGMQPIGHAPELIKQAFAAKQGDMIGPITGTEGVCVLRRLELKASHIPPFDEVQYRVRSDILRQQAVARAIAALGKLRERVLPALKTSGVFSSEKRLPMSYRRGEFRVAVETEPLRVDLPKPILVTLSQPFYPLFAGRGKSSYITGLPGTKPYLVRAIFRQPKGHVTPVVDEPDRTACYVAVPVGLLDPGAIQPFELFETADELKQLNVGLTIDSWNTYFNDRLQRP
jgi:hypothetical protein